MKKIYFSLLVLFALMRTNCMEKQSPFDKDQEEEIHRQAGGAQEEINREAAAARQEGFQWEHVEPTSKEISNYMFKPDYSTHSTIVNNDPKAGKSFFERRMRDGDDLISALINHSGLKLFDAILLEPFIIFLQQTKEDKQVNKLNNDVKCFTANKKNSELNSVAMKELFQQIQTTKNPRKKAELQAEYRILNQARKEINRQQRDTYKKFADDILKHKKRKKSQPTTIFVNQNGTLLKTEQEPATIEKQESEKNTMSDQELQ